MANNEKEIKFVISGLLALIGFIIMAKMGLWQLDRLKWKEGLIDKIEVQKTINPRKVWLTDMIDDVRNDMRRGRLVGIWSKEGTVKVGPQMMDGKIGYWIVTPLILNDGVAVLVNRGWVPDKMVELMLDSAPPLGVIELTGTLRQSDGESDMVANDHKSWHHFNIDGIANNNGIGRYAQLGLFMETSNPEDESVLKPAPVISSMRNEHLNYAIFWFGMALLIAVLFFLAVVQPNLPKRHSTSLPDPSDHES